MVLFTPNMVIVWLVLLIFAVPAIAMYLWNTTMPQVFGLKQITYWEGFRLLLLSAILFGVARL